MATAAQILANQANAQHSTGPVTPEGKARISQNARKFGLFSVAAFIRPEEQEVFAEFDRAYMAELSPATPLEQTLAREIVHAAWRLRRCADLETNPPENLTDEDLDRLQTSIDRARSAAQRTFHRSLKELRRIQSEHLCANALRIGQAEAAPTKQTRFEAAAPTSPASASATRAEFARQSQSEAAAASVPHDRTGRSVAVVRDSEKDRTGRWVAVVRDSEKDRTGRSMAVVRVPRNAACPCGSGNKYKRCCGKDAPPVLGAPAATVAAPPRD